MFKLSAWFMVWTAVTATLVWAHEPKSNLNGFPGDELKGAISCIHPNLIADLASRLKDRQDYLIVIQLYEDQGYCIEVDLPTFLVKSLSNKIYRTWDGNEAELWETLMVWPNLDGGYRKQRTFSIVFPLAMEKTFIN